MWPQQLTLPYVIDICTQLASGVEQLHASNVIHRDLKTDNALVASLSPLVIKWTSDSMARIDAPVRSLPMAHNLQWRVSDVFIVAGTTKAAEPPTESSAVLALGRIFIEVLTRCQCSNEPYGQIVVQLGWFMVFPRELDGGAESESTPRIQDSETQKTALPASGRVSIPVRFKLYPTTVTRTSRKTH